MSNLSGRAIWPYLTLMRPANLITAIADVSTGFAIGYMLSAEGVIWQGLAAHSGAYFLLWLSTIGLYGGGVVLNDVFDLELDKVERPERAIPSGAVSKRQATILGGSLMLIGILSAFGVGIVSGLLAIGICLAAILYDFKSKHHVFWGPLNMSICRGANLLLGVSVFASFLPNALWLVAFPILYIGSITLISQGEVAGGNKSHLKLALLGYACVFLSFFLLKLVYSFDVIQAIPFLALLGFLVFPPLVKASKSLAPGDIQQAVKSGVIALIVLNASLAAGFSGILYGLVILALLPVSIVLGKLFSVT